MTKTRWKSGSGTNSMLWTKPRFQRHPPRTKTCAQIARESVNPGSASSAIFRPTNKAIMEDNYPWLRGTANGFQNNNVSHADPDPANHMLNFIHACNTTEVAQCSSYDINDGFYCLFLQFPFIHHCSFSLRLKKQPFPVNIHKTIFFFRPLLFQDAHRSHGSG